MKKGLLTIMLISVASTFMLAQTNKTFFLGHSLVNFHMPNMLHKLSIAGTKTFSYKANIGNGANLQYHWNNPTTGQGDQWDTTLPVGGFEHFIVTEAVPLAGHLQWSATYLIADSFYNFAKLNNPNIQYYIYETWHCTNSGNGTTTGAGGYPCDWDPESTNAWRQRLTIDLPKWESIADSIYLKNTRPMLVIPAGQALARLTDSINAGAVAGLASVNELFSDNIHLDLRGNYFIACVMYSVIHKISPQGLPNQLTDEWGGLYSVFPTTAQATKMQQIAWETVCAYTRDGVNCNTVSIDDNLSLFDDFTIYPNPSKNMFLINSAKSINAIEIQNLLGETIYMSNSGNTATKIDVSHFSKGVYLLKAHTDQKTITKKIVIE